VGDVVRGEQPEIVRGEVLGVADLDGVSEASGEGLEERLEPCQEEADVRKRGLVERPELEDQGAELFAITLVGPISDSASLSIVW
jgi:hypothetical protein